MISKNKKAPPSPLFKKDANQIHVQVYYGQYPDRMFLVIIYVL
jgi:hypothetical protein